MKMRKLLSLLLAFALLLPTLLMGLVLDTAAETEGKAATTVTAVPNSYVTAGLVSLYSGTQNIRAGHDTTATVWEDLVSGYDVTLKTNEKNYFTEDGFRLNTAVNHFPSEIKDVVNGDSFTVEILLSGFVSLGSAYNTIMNSSNDNFALFRRNSEDVLEFKYAANAQDSRPKIKGGLEALQDVLITVTYVAGGDCIIYYNGVEQSNTPAPNHMGADDLFFGHDQDTRNFETTYRSIRFYNRDLSPAEVKRNAAVDGYVDVKELYVTEGLVSLYSGISNTETGYDPTATAWADLVSDNDLPLTADDKSYFNHAGLYLTGVQHYFPQTIVDLVNGGAFTVELSFDEFTSIGGSFNTFLNSKNDNFALFRRNSNDVLEFKFAGNPGNERPTVSDGLNLIDHGTVSVTFEVGGKCRVYVDGTLMAEVAVPKAMGADNLFIGHVDPSKLFETTYRSIRFYNRVLTDEEIAKNAASDGTLFLDESRETVPTYISVAQPRTNIVGDVAVTREITSKAELTSMMAGKSLPAAAIYTVNDKLQVLNEDDKTFATLSEVLTATEYKVLPILIPTNAAAVDAIAAFTKETKFTDICILSKDAALVNQARAKMPTVRGAVDFTETYKDVELTREKCLDIRRTVKSNAASVAVLPANIATQEMVQYLYDNQINVWVKAADDLNEADTCHALLSGATGVISDDTATLLTVACDLPENTMTRTPLNVGHRAIPSKAPENTVEGALYAYEHGADCIEIDVYLTRDGEVVVMHDGTTGRTCDKDLSVEDSTWAQLSELYVNKGYENHETYKNCRIPRLQDFLETFKDTECRFFIEIKSGKSAIVPAIKKLVDEYGMYGQCSVITFNTGIMEAMRKDYPEMSVGALCSGYMGETNPDADMKAVMGFIGKTNATLNPSYAGYGENAIRAALIRGIGVFPWTFRGNANVYQDHFIWGYSGLTGDNADVLTRFVKSVALKNEALALPVGEAVTLELLVTYYDRRASDVKPDVTVVAGADGVTLEGNKLTVNKVGAAAVVVLSHTYRLGNETVTVCTQPITISAESEGATETTPETTAPDEPVVTDPPTTPEATSPVGGVDTSDVTVSSDTQPADDKGCASVASDMSIALLTAVTLLGGAWKLRKKDE